MTPIVYYFEYNIDEMYGNKDRNSNGLVATDWKKGSSGRKSLTVNTLVHRV